MFSKRYGITLLFNANKVYDRQVIEGIGEYLQASQADWDIFFEDDFRCRIDRIRDWMGDGIIADYDDPEIVAATKDLDIPVIGVGGSYHDPSKYPNMPYVATDNAGLVKAAYEHLREKGLEQFAFYGLPESPQMRWAQERELAFKELVQADGYNGEVYRGTLTTPENWRYAMNRIADWLQRLPHPIGIIAVTDARARHLLQVCERLGLIVPDKVAVIGIDNEDLARYLTRVPLSSVNQGCKNMGYEAAKLLHRELQDKPVKRSRILIPPQGVVERQSTDFKALKDAYVIQAMHFIRHNACKGIKVDQVLDFVGISRSNLEKRFRDERGHSIHTEIHESKLQRAQQLLRSSELPTAEIASLCGYPSLQYMYAVFKKDLGQTPKEYRNNRSDGTLDPDDTQDEVLLADDG
ncbi:DNA-binding transcriptional regulator [Neiella sp. HB171785]|uniref:DNA-binding transcriptional regulator n=1 Tax=Neiella litorisoli TaxID=2771431 RepID=A0A8J6UEM5_9GAMM|nr:DNA-binding transcriptional regulator [Neiella litorisoli]